MDIKECIEQNNKMQAAIKAWAADKDDKAFVAALNTYEVYLDKLTVEVNKESNINDKL